LDWGDIGWYAVYTRHQHEKVAAASLVGKGFETFLPLYREIHRWKDRKQAVLLPLFPCYVFVRALIERKGDILRTPGVCSVVGNGGENSRIPPQELDAIRLATANSKTIQPYPLLREGDRVRVVSGALCGVEGILIRVKNQHRLVLSVQLLTSAAIVDVDVAAVERIRGESRTHDPSRLITATPQISIPMIAEPAQRK
jgi:transcription antitermination factor NusG